VLTSQLDNIPEMAAMSPDNFERAPSRAD